MECVLDRRAANRGYPAILCMDNVLELLSLILVEWAEIHAVKLGFVRLGKSTFEDEKHVRAKSCLNRQIQEQGRYQVRPQPEYKQCRRGS